MEYVFHLPSESLALLETCVGREVFELGTLAVEVRENCIWAPDFAIRRGPGDYIVIANDWAETPSGIDYGILQCGRSASPRDVDVHVTDGIHEVQWPVSWVHTTTGNGPISAVSVFETVHVEDAETVRYDSAIMLTTDDEEWALACESGIIGGLVYIAHTNEVARLRSERPRILMR